MNSTSGGYKLRERSLRNDFGVKFERARDRAVSWKTHKGGHGGSARQGMSIPVTKFRSLQVANDSHHDELALLPM